MRRILRVSARNSGIRLIASVAAYALEETRPNACTNAAMLYKPGGLREALNHLEQGEVRADCSTYARLLRVCRNERALVEGKAVHSHIIRDGLQEEVLLGDLLVDMYIRCGSVEDARQAFCAMPKKDIGTWTKMIAAYAQKGHHMNALRLFRQMQLEGVVPNKITFVATLNSCAGPDQARFVHGCIVEADCEDDIFVATALVSGYGKCGNLEDARRIFDKMPERDVVSWTALIAAYAEYGHCRESLKLYDSMHLEGILPNRVTFLALLNACTSLGSLAEGKLIHSHIAESGNHSDIVIENSIISMYDKCGSLEDAKTMFDQMPRKDVISWTAMIAAYAQHGKCKVAIQVFRKMKLEGEKPNKVTFITIVEASSNLSAVGEGELAHQCISECGLDADVMVATALVDMYGKSSTTLEQARRLFEGIQKRDIILWNTVITAYAQHGYRAEALKLYEQMQRERFLPDKVTFIAVLGGVNSPTALSEGRWLHACIVSRGFESDAIVRNALLNMYGKCCCPEDAQRLFDEMPQQQNLVSWNTMIAVYSQNGDCSEALAVFRRMQLQGIPADKATLVTVLYACSSRAALADGRLVHRQLVESGYEHDINLGTALVVMYAKCGTLEDAIEMFEAIQHRDTASWNAMIAAYGYHGLCEEARKAFDGMQGRRDLASWNAMISAYAQHARCREAFRLFQEMQIEGWIPNAVTFVTVLNACASVTALAEGKAVHRFAAENGFTSDIPVGNAIVNLYGKCGSLVQARCLFDGMLRHDIVTWNALVAGYAQHGHGKQALELVHEMQADGIMPNKVTFISVLHACCHVGLLREGCNYFSSMSRDYGLEPTEEHCGCMIDLLGRAGHLGDAEEFINKIPFDASVVTWMSLLGSCRMHGDLERAKCAARKVLQHDSQNAAAHVVLSSIYAATEYCDGSQ